MCHKAARFLARFWWSFARTVRHQIAFLDIRPINWGEKEANKHLNLPEILIHLTSDVEKGIVRPRALLLSWNCPINYYIGQFQDKSRACGPHSINLYCILLTLILPGLPYQIKHHFTHGLYQLVKCTLLSLRSFLTDSYLFTFDEVHWLERDVWRKDANNLVQFIRNFQIWPFKIRVPKILHFL